MRNHCDATLFAAKTAALLALPEVPSDLR